MLLEPKGSLLMGAVLRPQDRIRGMPCRTLLLEMRTLVRPGRISLKFVGRLPVLDTLEELDELALKRILEEPW